MAVARLVDQPGWCKPVVAVVNRPAAVPGHNAVFVSYSHDDQDWRRKFTQILAPLVRNRRQCG
jgi:hypothetical protein